MVAVIHIIVSLFVSQHIMQGQAQIIIRTIHTSDYRHSEFVVTLDVNKMTE
jgi:hypothetical protein